MFFLTHSDIKLNLNKIFLAAASVHLSKNKELIGDGGGKKTSIIINQSIKYAPDVHIYSRCLLQFSVDAHHIVFCPII